MNFKDSFRKALNHYAGKLVHSTDYFASVLEFAQAVARHPEQVDVLGMKPKRVRQHQHCGTAPCLVDRGDPGRVRA